MASRSSYRYGLANLGFCSLRCDHISEHEAIILSLVCSLRDGRRDRFQPTLALLVDEDGIGGLIEAIAQLGKAMSAVGIYPERPLLTLPNGNAG